MTELAPITRLFNSGSYEEDLYAKSLGWETPSMLLMERAIVISVNLGIDINPTASYLPQYSINARIIGNTSSSYIPETEIPEWFFPLFPNSIVSLPEVGEQILIMKENVRNDSQGFWIGRVNDTDKVSFKGANAQLGAPGVTPMEQYGMRFRSNALHNRSPQPTAFANRPFFQIPARLGDVFMQGRNGTYIRHSYNPNYGPDGKPGILEMGVLQNRLYGNNEEPTLGKTRTKTVHFSNAKLADTGLDIIKSTPNDDDITVTPGAGGDTFTANRKNFIINTANEIYNVSDMPDADQALNRQVLGEKLNTYLLEENEIMRETLDELLNVLTDTVAPLFGAFMTHEHVIPEINIDLPDKEITTTEVVNLGMAMMAQPDEIITIPAQTIVVPADAGGTITIPGTPAVTWTDREVRSWHYTQGHEPALGPPEGMTGERFPIIPEEWGMAANIASAAGVVVGGVKIAAIPSTTQTTGANMPGHTITVPAKTISVPVPPKLTNLGFQQTEETQTIDFESISIGGAANPRFTTKVESSSNSSAVLQGLNNLQVSVTELKNKIIALTQKTNDHLSQRQFIN